MSDHEPEQPEREHERSPERITFAEAGRRLGRTADAVRMGANRGAIATVTVDGRRWVVWPQPERSEQGEPEHERSPRSDRSDAAPDIEPQLLRELVDELRAELADVRTDRDHWRAQAERLTGLLEADRVIALQSGAVDVDVDVDADAIEAATEQAQERAPEALQRDELQHAGDGTSQPSAPVRIGRWLRGLVPFP